MGAALKEWAPIDAGTSARRTLAADGVTVADLRYPAGGWLPRHAHKYATVTVTLEGEFDCVLDSRRIHNPLNAVLAKPIGEPHGNSFGNGARLLMLCVEESNSWFAGFREVRYGVDARAGGLAAALARELTSPDDVTPLSVSGLARELLALAVRLPPANVEARPPPWLLRGIEFVEANLHAVVGLRRVAGVCGVHRVYFARAFRAHTGDSLGDYVRKLRVRRAADRLAASDEPIAAIALSLGFADQSHFTRVFRDATGMTPACYRRTRRSG